MSSDNYYTIREEDGLFYLFTGSMSGLMDGFPARSRASFGFDTKADALVYYFSQPQGFMKGFYSEYGLVDENDYDLLTAEEIEARIKEEEEYNAENSY